MPFRAGFGVELPKPGGGTPHLWIAVTDPLGNPPKTVLVNFTTLRADTADTTVILEPEEHPYLSRRSVVYYQDADIRPAEPFYEASRHSSYPAFPDCPEATLQRIQDGILDSPFTPNKVKRYCRRLWE